MRLIGLHGSYGCGKSTAVEMLKQSLVEAGDNTKVTLVKFAAPLYDIQEYIYSRVSSVYKRDASFVKDRKLLQWIGTDWGRETIGINVWVDIWKAEVEAAWSRGELVICDDARFDNEGELIKSMGGTLIKIERTNAAAHAQGGTGIANHASEAGIDKKFIDYVIKNDSDLNSYKESLAHLFRQLSTASEESGA